MRACQNGGSALSAQDLVTHSRTIFHSKEKWNEKGEGTCCFIFSKKKNEFIGK